MSDFQRWALDTLERAAKTFVQAYLSVWIAIGGTSFDTLFTRDNLEAGVVGLALAVASAVGARRVGAPDSASLLPADTDPPQDRGQSVLVTALVAAAVCIVLLLAFDLINIG
jgi:hypothetical protein